MGEKMFEVIIRLEREVVLGMNDDHRVSQSRSYPNSYKFEGLSNVLPLAVLVRSLTS